MISPEYAPKLLGKVILSLEAVDKGRKGILGSSKVYEDSVGSAEDGLKGQGWGRIPRFRSGLLYCL